MEKLFSFLFCFLLISVIVCSPAKEPSDEAKKHREYDRDLSDVDHHEDDEDHDSKYDHDAFLGKDEAKKFDDLSPEESKQRLGKIVDKIDKDNDGKVTHEELKNWISYISKRYLSQDADRQWKEHDTAKDNKLSWEAYKTKAFGDEKDSSSNENSYKQMIMRDERRWKKADLDGDGLLSKEEFTDFLHPEEAAHMKEIVVQETLDDIDKNHDGFIDLEEYIKDMWTATEEEKTEPDWVKTERDTFAKNRDKNNDGKLDHDEIRAWIMPDDYDHVESEAKHLLTQADANNDGILSKDEILNKYDVFVGSQATDFGEALTRHEEL